MNYRSRCYRLNRLATSRPLGKRTEPFLAAKRPTASDEVARGRLVSLEGFSFAFRAKNGEWRAFRVSGFICESLTSMAEGADSTPSKSIERVCVSPSSKEQICLLCAKVVPNNDFRRKLTTSGSREKTKTCFNLESILGKEISQPREKYTTSFLSFHIKEQNRWEISSLEQNYKVTYHTIASL